MAQPFAEDEKLQQAMTQNAAWAVQIAQNRFKLKLDWTDDSIRLVESMLDMLHKRYLGRMLSEATCLGCYIGEVFRRNHGATWVTLDGVGVLSEKPETRGIVSWPTSKAEKRIRNGPEDNVWHYYQMGMLGKPTLTA
jgi:hypothetical protein